VIRASSPLPAGDARASVIDRYVGNMSVVEEARAGERGALGALEALVCSVFWEGLFFPALLSRGEYLWRGKVDI